MTDVRVQDGRREQLVAVGMRLFSVRPYDAISIDEIAHEAGIAKGLLYYYFPSKRDFYVAVVRSAADEMSAVVEPDDSVPPLDRLVHSVNAYLDYVESHARGYATLLRGGIGSDDEVRKIIDGTREQVLERALSSLPLAGKPSPALRVAVRGWIGFVEGASLDWLEHRDLTREQLRDLLVHAFVTMLQAVHAVDPSLRLDPDALADGSPR
jgi:AcrR family transcriptional regulator